MRFLVYIVLVLSFVGCKDRQSSQDRQEKLLLISFDGFRHDYLNKVPTPNFDTLAANGTIAEGLIPVFPSKTFPNHYAIATGLYPENSGFVGNTMYDPKWDEWYRIRDRNAVEDGKWYGGEPIWNTLEKQGVRTGTMFWVGSEADIQGMYPTHWKRFDDTMPFKARVDTVVQWLSAPDSKAVDFGTLYFEHVDAMGHNYGTNSDSLKAAIQTADQIIGYLKQQLRKVDLWKQTNILIVSDHGMVDLSAEKIIELDAIVSMDNIQRTIWGPLTMVQPKKGKEEEVYGALKENEDHYRVYYKEEIPERYHLKNHRRVSDIIIIADLGYTILNSEYKPRFLDQLPRATHGFDPSNKEMQAFFLAYGPAFKKGKKVKVFSNVHLYELMNYLLGIQPAPNDGSIDSVRVMLN